MAVLAAVYALGSFLPGFPIIGFSGSNIDIVRSLEMGYGFILGPIYGPLTAFLGAIVGKTLTGGGFGLYFTPLALVSSFTAAALIKNRLVNVRGWMLSAGVLGILILSWYVLPTGREIPMYPVLHFVALGIILLFRDKFIEYLSSEDGRKLTIGVALSSYSSTMAGQMLGTLIFIVLLKPQPGFLISTLPVSAVERIAITCLSTIISTPLILAVRSVYPDLLREN